MQKKIIGLHLGGAHTKKSAVVRGNLVYEKNTPRFLLDVSIGNIGETKYRNTDERLVEILSDLMPFDTLCIDTATSLPPCVHCPLPCPGVALCEVNEVNKMKVSYDQQMKQKTLEKGKGRHTRFMRLPQPYFERSYELYLKTNTVYAEVKNNHDLESTLGANRAPLSLRSMRLMNEFKSLFPNVLIFETPSLLATQGLSKILLNSIPSTHEMKEKRYKKNLFFSFKQLMLKELTSQNILIFENSHSVETKLNIENNLNEFLALMSALIPWADVKKLTQNFNNYFYYSELFKEQNIECTTSH
jgi:hypothetical protein